MNLFCVDSVMDISDAKHHSATAGCPLTNEFPDVPKQMVGMERDTPFSTAPHVHIRKYTFRLVAAA